MRFLKVSTEVTVKIGPFLDKTNGVDEETGLAGGGTEIAKTGGAFGAGPTLGTHDAEGWYPITLTTSHTDTVGALVVKSHDSATHLPVWHEFMVLPAAIYDWLVGGSVANVPANVIQVNGTAQTARDLGASVLLSPGTGTGQISLASGAVTAGTVSDKTGYSLTATTGLGNQTADITGNLSGSVGSVTGNVGGNVLGSVASVTAGVTLAASAVQAIWDALTSALTTVGSVGKLIVDNVNATISSRLASADITLSGGAVTVGTNNDKTGYGISGTITTLDALDAAQDSQHSTTQAALAALNDLSSADVTAAVPTVAQVADGVWDEAKAGHVGAGSFGEEVQAHALSSEVSALNNLSAAEVNAEVLDVLATDTVTQPGQETPVKDQTIAKMVAYLYKAWRNKSDQDGSTYKLYNDAGSVVDHKAAVTDDTTTVTKGKVGTGP